MIVEIWEPLPEYPHMSAIRVQVACTDGHGHVLTYRTWPADEEWPENAINWKAETLREFYRRREP